MHGRIIRSLRYSPKTAPNGKDAGVYDQPPGARCDFNDDKSFCDGWTMLTVEQGKPVNDHLLQIKLMPGNVGPIHPSRPGGGAFLLYSYRSLNSRIVRYRQGILTSRHHFILPFSTMTENARWVFDRYS
ncbi:hypothetical protein COOONC_25429, partial [Cooperia oncophora]